MHSRSVSESAQPVNAANAIDVRRVWKRFSRAERYDSLRDLVPAMTGRLARRGSPTLGRSEFWAVRDVSFTVPPGEAFGIIGPNGAGKSTLLKLLTRILRPTAGQCNVRGRVGALIELGAAFHGDLTGRENIFLQAAIMGMRKKEAARVLDAIVEFAGVEQFIDAPVKRYSSGMHARLGFAIAAHIDPDVLIIDEVLSVGDMAFQEKCIARMEEFKRRGIAIVFVSHNMQAVSDLCDRAMYLHADVRAIGTPFEVIREYVQVAARQQVRASGDAIDVLAVRLDDDRGPLVSALAPGAALRLDIECVANKALRDLHVGLQLHRSTDNLIVYHGVVDRTELGLDEVRAGQRFTLRFRFHAHLAGGHYYFACQIYHNPTQEALVRLSPAGLLSVLDTRTSKGIADLEMECTVE